MNVVSFFNIHVLFYIEENLDSDPAVMERNIKRLQMEESKNKNQDVNVIQHLMSVTLETRYHQLVEVSDGKNRVCKALRDWPVLGKEIHVSI